MQHDWTSRDENVWCWKIFWLELYRLLLGLVERSMCDVGTEQHCLEFNRLLIMDCPAVTPCGWRDSKIQLPCGAQHDQHQVSGTENALSGAGYFLLVVEYDFRTNLGLLLPRNSSCLAFTATSCGVLSFYFTRVNNCSRDCCLTFYALCDYLDWTVSQI